MGGRCPTWMPGRRPQADVWVRVVGIHGLDAGVPCPDKMTLGAQSVSAHNAHASHEEVPDAVSRGAPANDQASPAHPHQAESLVCTSPGQRPG